MSETTQPRDLNELWRNTGPLNPNAIPEHMRDMTQEDRDAIATALDTVFTHLRDGTSELIHNLLQDEGWYDRCEDCDSYISVDQLGNACPECGHVNGDPMTGSTTDDVPMRVCDNCWAGQHEHCDHEIQLFEDGITEPPTAEWYCNCGRLGHPPITVPTPSN